MEKALKVRREVQLFREAVGKLVALLTSRSIKVTETGSTAYCVWDSKGVLQRINLPSIPDDASDRLLFAMQGYIDHEVAHVLYTDPMVSSRLSGKGAHHVWNVIEDIFIERRMSAVFLGSRRNLYKVHSHMLETVFEPGTESAISSSTDDDKLFFTWFLMPACRAKAGHPAYVEFMEKYWSHFPRHEACLDAIRFSERIHEANSSGDCVVLAVDLLRALKESTEARPEKDSPDEESTKSKKAVLRPSRGGSGKAADLSEFDEVEYDSTPAGGDEYPDNEEGAGDDEDKSDEPDKGSDLEKEDPFERLSDKPPEPPEESEKSRFPDRAMSDKDLKELASSEEIDAMGVEAAASKLIHEEVSTIGKDTYLPYSRSYDFSGYLEDVSAFINEHKAPEWQKAAPYLYEFSVKAGMNLFKKAIAPQITGKLRTLAKELERAVVSKNRTSYTPGQRRGKVHGPSLFRLALNDDRIFRKREETEALNACVQIIVDMSGSMGGKRITLAAASAWAMADALDKIRVPNMITGFTTFGYIPVSEDFHRIEPLLLPILKGWEEKANSEIVHARCGAITDYHLANNVDGESLLALSNHMVSRREERKIIFLLSDGEPAAMGHGHRNHLVQVGRYVEDTLGYELLGVGIQCDAPSRFYRNSVRIDNINQLPETIAGAVRNILLKGKF